MIPSEPSTRVFMAEYLNAQSWPYCSEQRGDIARYGLNKLPACTRGHRYLHYGYFIFTEPLMLIDPRWLLRNKHRGCIVMHKPAYSAFHELHELHEAQQALMIRLRNSLNGLRGMEQLPG